MLLLLNAEFTSHLILVLCLNERLANLAMVDDKAAVLTERGEILLVLNRKLLSLDFVNGNYDAKRPEGRIRLKVYRKAKSVDLTFLIVTPLAS